VSASVTAALPRNLAELVEENRFVGREFLLWLWFESEIHETNVRATAAGPCSLWIETQITLAAEGVESRLKGPMPAASPEAKEALRQGKLPREARMRMLIGDLEYAWVMKADELAIGGLKVPAQLTKDTDKYEALYERMRLVEQLETQLEALFADFLALRMSTSWDEVVVPLLRSWTNDGELDLGRYASARTKKRPRGRAAVADAVPS
jgi:hypothetical protein